MSISTPNARTNEAFSWEAAEELLADASRQTGLAHACAVQSQIQRDATDAAMHLMSLCRAEHGTSR